MRPLNEIIVHCTATPADWRADQTTSAKVAAIRQMHLDRGWSDIGYHYIIDRDGTVMRGRPLDRVGAHVAGHNTGTIGISLFGGHGSTATDKFGDNFTPAQEKALRALIGELRRDYPTIKKVTGHNQYAAKACPGFNAERWYNNRPQRESLMESTTLQATAAGGASTVVGVATIFGELDKEVQLVLIACAGIVVITLAYIARERIKKWARGIR
jgi:N-acetylmuramoyl-L-alanine amidase